jgi:serine/threonine-protein kinase
LTGQKLDMGGSQFQLVEKRRRVPDLGGIDMRIRPLLEQMLQPDPANRPATMAEIANWRVASSAPRALYPLDRVETAPVRPEYNLEPKPNRRSLWLILAAVFLAALVGEGLYAVYTLVLAPPAIVRPPPLPEFGQKSQAALPEPKASRPAAPAPSAGDGAVRTDRVRRFVEQYSGGNCFFIVPVAISSNAAVIEGFGASTVPFDALDKAFKRDLGFEASIGARLVTQAQCPAIKFLGEHTGSPARTPRINLSSIEVRNGETLSGTIENFANRVVELLLVSDSGEVQNLSYLLKPGIDSLSFSIPMQRGSGGDGPQLVMAVATPQVLDSLRQPKPTAADTFFLQAVSEAQRNDVAIVTATRYFRLKN